MAQHTRFLSKLYHFHPHLRLSNVNIWGALVFTMGCLVLVVNAILSFLPYAGYGFHLPPRIVYVEGVLSILSNIFFLTGSGFAFVQILNAKRAELYDESKSKMAVSEEDVGLKAETPTPSITYTESASSSSDDLTESRRDSVCEEKHWLSDEKSEMPTPSICIVEEVLAEDMDLQSEKWTPSIVYYDETASTTSTPAPSRRHSLSEGTTWLGPVMGIYAMTPASSTENLVAGMKPDNEKDLESQSPQGSAQLPEELWRYVPSTHEMWVRSIHEIGFLATTIFFCSSLVYFSSSIASIISIAHTGEISRWIRYPQLVAAVGFAVASTILMVQAQEKWWRPAWRRVRWYVNLMNLVGSFGFIVCACFGLVENVYWARYQFGMSYLWGSWAFFFGSAIQWYKALNKNAMVRRKEWVNDGFDRDKDLMF